MSGNTGLLFMAAVGAALLTGMVWGVKLEDSANRRATRRSTARRTRSSAQDGAKTPDTPSNKRLTVSKLIALGVLAIDASCTYIVLYLCWLSIRLQFSGSLPYLTTLIGALQAATGYVLGHYFKKSCKENTKGGITYDAALGTAKAAVPDSDAASIFDTV